MPHPERLARVRLRCGEPGLLVQPGRDRPQRLAREEPVGHLADHCRLLRDQHPAGAVPELRRPMPVAPLSLLPVRASDAISLVPGLVRGHRDELPGHQPALVRVQIERPTHHRFDADRMRLHQVNQIFQLARTAVEAIHMPHHNPRRTLSHPSQQLLKLGTLLVQIRGRVVIHEHVLSSHIQPEATAQRQAVISLALDSGFLASPILTDPQIDQNLIRNSGSLARSRPPQHTHRHLDTST